MIKSGTNTHDTIHGNETQKVAALCAGYGGLELALKQLGIDCEVDWFAEIDSSASRVFGTRHPQAVNLGDLSGIHEPPPVDLVTAGFPCQPVSTAGKRKGIYDERWIIEDVCRIARDSGAQTLILENVSGLLSANDGAAMSRVIAALAANGFNARWTCVRASQVGAPHRRLRWFCLCQAQPTSNTTSTKWGKTQPPLLGSSGWETSKLGKRPRSSRSFEWGKYESAIKCWEIITNQKAPEPANNQNFINPLFVEWMMGLPKGWVTDVIEDPGDAIRILGNGVVPQQASYALWSLMMEDDNASNS